MLKPLLKKQLREFTAFFTLSKKDGKRRSPLAIFGFALLMLYALCAIVVMFYLIADMLCVPLVGSGLAWVYFAFLGAIGTAFACIGSAFGAKVQLYEAKDNDLLLSMPIKPWEILLSRMLGLYAMTFAFCNGVFLPALVCYFYHFSVQILPLIFGVITAFILPIGALAISCLLGWLIALVTSKIRAKNLFTMLFTIAFLIVYFVLYSKMNEYLQFVIANGEALGAKMKTALWLFYQMGLGITGKPLSLLAFIGCFIAVFALVYLLLSKSFLRLATANRGGFRKKYKAKHRAKGKVFTALFKRETLRFFKNPMVILNCSLGSILLLIIPVFALFNMDFCREIASINADGLFATILALIACGVATTNIVTASSVSLEGKTIWQVQSLPVDAFSVLVSKILLHLCVSALPTVLAVAVLCVLLKIGVWYALVCVLTCVAFVGFCATSGLLINLKMPNLHFTNEITAVKQSMSVLVSMLVNMGAVGLFVGGYFWFGKYLPEIGYLAICIAVLLLASVAIIGWLNKRGARIFSYLQA
ncbi:MAG: hypothetical protein IKL76_00340 [Clostridia bacterium]|nr:hypothetical protein [Clostridia bacterium]